MAKQKVLFNHDAAIDEFMAALLLTTMEEVDYLGSVIMNADCIYTYAMQAQWKIQEYLGINQKKNPITLSRARQWNPFPWQYRGDCNNFALKDGWGEFNLKPDELLDAQNQYGLTPELLESSTKRIIDMYADAFGGATSKLVFNNFDQFSWQDIATPYNAKMIPIANYALNRGIGNRDGQIEHWMRYTQKIYGMRPSVRER